MQLPRILWIFVSACDSCEASACNLHIWWALIKDSRLAESAPRFETSARRLLSVVSRRGERGTSGKRREEAAGWSAAVSLSASQTRVHHLADDLHGLTLAQKRRPVTSHFELCKFISFAFSPRQWHRARARWAPVSLGKSKRFPPRNRRENKRTSSNMMATNLEIRTLCPTCAGREPLAAIRRAVAILARARDIRTRDNGVSCAPWSSPRTIGP